MPWTDRPGVVESVNRCDWLIVGGGGLFNCYLEYSAESYLRQSHNFAAFVFSLPVLAFLAGKRSFIYGVGASRFYSDAALEHARMAVRIADVCTVRDRESRRILGPSLSERRPIAVHADPGFRLANAPLPEAALAEAGIQAGEPVVAAAPRNWTFETDQKAWEDKVTEALREFAIRHSVRVLFIPFHAGYDVPGDLNNDPALIARMREAIGVNRTAELRHGLRPGEVSAVLSMCEMTIAVRLHAAILSIRNATPFVALAYEPKVSRILAGCGLERFVAEVPAGTAAARDLSALLERVWSDRDLIRKRLHKVSRLLAADAHRHVDLLRRAVNRKPGARRIDAKTAEFLRQIAASHTRCLAEMDANRPEEEQRSVIAGIRAFLDAGELEPASRMLLCWRPSRTDTMAEREYLLGFCLQHIGKNPEAALKHYDSAIQFGFDEFWVLYNRGQLLMHLGEGRSHWTI